MSFSDLYKRFSSQYNHALKLSTKLAIQIVSKITIFFLWPFVRSNVLHENLSDVNLYYEALEAIGVVNIIFYYNYLFYEMLLGI